MTTAVPWKRVEIIGNATLYLGDCLEILPHLPKVDAVITDPPYGVGVNYGDGFDDSRKDYWDWLRATIATIRANCKTLIFTHRVTALRELQGWDWVGVWNKPGSFGSRLGNSAVLPHWEPIFMYGIHLAGVKTDYIADVLSWNPEVAKAGNTGIGREKWSLQRHRAEESQQAAVTHPCPKPVGLMERLIKAFSPGATCDTFMGSGTTGVACMNLGRKFIGIEIESKYFEIACERIENAQRQLRMFA